MRGRERSHLTHPHGPRHLGEHVGDELLVHVADEVLLLVDDRVVRAGNEADAQRPVVDVGLESGVFEVLVEGVELVHGGFAELRGVIELGCDPTQQVAVLERQADATLGGSALGRCGDGAVDDGRAPAGSAMHRGRRDEPLVLEDLQVLAHRVRVQSGLVDELMKRAVR